MPKIPNPFDMPTGGLRKKLLPRKDPKPFGDYGQGRNMPSKRNPPKYFGYGNKPAPYGKKKLGAGVDTRPTERDSQIRKSQYGPPRTARDIELTKKPSRKMPPSRAAGRVIPKPMPPSRAAGRVIPKPMPKKPKRKP